MIIKKYGKCVECRRPCTEKREFVATINMFQPESSGITPEIKKQIIAFREEDLFCEPHREPALVH